MIIIYPLGCQGAFLGEKRTETYTKYSDDRRPQVERIRLEVRSTGGGKALWRHDQQQAHGHADRQVVAAGRL